MTERKIYASRYGAVRAARNACRKALNSPIYQAKEGPDYEIHPATDDRISYLSEYAGPSFYLLRGPAKDALANRNRGR